MITSTETRSSEGNIDIISGYLFFNSVRSNKFGCRVSVFLGNYLECHRAGIKIILSESIEFVHI